MQIATTSLDELATESSFGIVLQSVRYDGVSSAPEIIEKVTSTLIAANSIIATEDRREPVFDKICVVEYPDIKHLADIIFFFKPNSINTMRLAVAKAALKDCFFFDEWKANNILT